MSYVTSSEPNEPRTTLHRLTVLDRSSRPNPFSDPPANLTLILRHFLSVDQKVKDLKAKVDLVKGADERGELSHQALFPSLTANSTVGTDQAAGDPSGLSMHDQLKSDLEVFTRLQWAEWEDSAKELKGDERRLSYRAFRLGRAETWPEKFRAWRKGQGSAQAK